MTWWPWLIFFYFLQIVANLIFKYGAMATDRFWAAFFLGNFFGGLSILPLMRLYQNLPLNIANAIACGVSFLIVQIAFVFVFRERLTSLQYIGVTAMAIGMFLLSWGKAPQ
jgi:multidrug transporter EmrE-like cation transporter